MLKFFGRILLAFLMLGALATAVRALDRTTYFAAEYERIFQKIYLSVLFGSPQSIPSTEATCTKLISPEMGMYGNEKNRVILGKLPVGRIDEDFAKVLRSYMFWPIRCAPVRVEDISVSLYGMGAPKYLRIAFLPTQTCSDFMSAIKAAIYQKSIHRLMMNDKEYELASYYYMPSMLVAEYMMRKNKEFQINITEKLLLYLTDLEIRHNCESGMLEFK